MGGEFTSEQKRYLEGFTSGLQVGRLKAEGGAAAGAKAAPTGPDAPMLLAMAAQEAKGKKLTDIEKGKREKHPLDDYETLKLLAANDQFPKGNDTFRMKYFGLFYVAPAQDAFMCRLRIHNGILNAWQLTGLAKLADDCAGGYAHVTTRANFQIREIAARHGVEVVERIVDLGLASKGSGGDNIRNVTGDATAGIAPGELLDTRPHARDWHFHILNTRAMYNLPRKFNVAFDGGGPIPTLEDTNDIGFQAVRLESAPGIADGVYYRLMLGGISGHKDLARFTGVIVPPRDATKVADAIVRVLVESGDRSDRNKARMKYVLDDWGYDKYLEAVELKLGAPFLRVEEKWMVPRPVQDRLAHVGVHPQKQPGFNYVGVVLHVGRMSSDQMRAVATISRECGDGDVRLTVWQNLLISGVPDGTLDDVKTRLEAAGLEWRATSIRAGLVACTGSQGCKFANATTKVNAEEIAAWCEPKVALDTPVNIHVTGCKNSCAQHYIGDLGLIGVRVPINDDGDTVDGYNVFVGGGFSETASIGRQLYDGVKATDAPAVIERVLKGYMAHRSGPEQTFHAFAASHEIDAIKTFAEQVEA